MRRFESLNNISLARFYEMHKSFYLNFAQQCYV
jgi:hypothetical protein